VSLLQDKKLLGLLAMGALAAPPLFELDVSPRFEAS